MRRIKGFTLIELMVVISIIVMLIGILLPSLGRARVTARRMQGATQVRGVQQSMVTFAQSNNNNYPGRQNTGAVIAAGNITLSPLDGNTVEGRLAVMIENGDIPAEILVNPQDGAGVIAYATGSGVDVVSTNYSYALLHTVDDSGLFASPEGAAATRRNEQRLTLVEESDSSNHPPLS